MDRHRRRLADRDRAGSGRTTPQVLRKGGVLLATKALCGVLVAIVAGRMPGEQPVAYGFFTGLSTLARVTAINDTNGGLYMAVMAQYGTPREVAAYSILSLESGPFLTMLTLGVASPHFGGRHRRAAGRMCLEGGATAAVVVRELGWQRFTALEALLPGGRGAHFPSRLRTGKMPVGPRHARLMNDLTSDEP